MKQFDELKETLKTQVAHDQKIELDGLRAENAKYESIIMQKTCAVEESNEKMKLLEESLARTRSLNEQIQADYESNLIQTENLNKQLATSKEQLVKLKVFFSQKFKFSLDLELVSRMKKKPRTVRLTSKRSST